MPSVINRRCYSVDKADYFTPVDSTGYEGISNRKKVFDPLLFGDCQVWYDLTESVDNMLDDSGDRALTSVKTIAPAYAKDGSNYNLVQTNSTLQGDISTGILDLDSDVYEFPASVVAMLTQPYSIVAIIERGWEGVNNGVAIGMISSGSSTSGQLLNRGSGSSYGYRFKHLKSTPSWRAADESPVSSILDEFQLISCGLDVATGVAFIRLDNNLRNIGGAELGEDTITSAFLGAQNSSASTPYIGRFKHIMFFNGEITAEHHYEIYNKLM